MNDHSQTIFHRERKRRNCFSVEELVPKSPIGKELNERFKEQMFRANPSESPMARALRAHGYKVIDYPLYPEYTDSDWLASCVIMGGLKIIFRQPTSQDLVVCFIARELAEQKMASALLGIVEFFSFCRYDCPELKYVGGNMDKRADYQNNDGALEKNRLIDFYNRLLGEVESYEENGVFFIYADLHKDSRYEKFPLWKRYRRKKRTTF